MSFISSEDLFDPSYCLLKCIRYPYDFAIGISDSRKKVQIFSFATLKLNLNLNKTSTYYFSKDRFFLRYVFSETFNSKKLVLIQSETVRL